MATYVLVHGSFWGSRAWTDLARLLRAAGHDVYAPSLTGLGERVHLASPEITLDTHILDVSGTLTYEELQDVVLVGHSYAGMVLTGVAERMPERIAHLVFLDAGIPRDGESLSSMMGPDWTELVLQLARTQGDGWRFGSRRADMGSLSPQEQSWYGRATPQPIQTWLQPLAVRNPAAALIRGPSSFARTGSGLVMSSSTRRRPRSSAELRPRARLAGATTSCPRRTTPCSAHPKPWPTSCSTLHRRPHRQPRQRQAGDAGRAAHLVRPHHVVCREESWTPVPGLRGRRLDLAQLTTLPEFQHGPKWPCGRF
jgi:pimeloyl-ACP methyl ester carboxylesterase